LNIEKLRAQSRGMPGWNRIYREVESANIPGTYLTAFIKNGAYYATEIKIYKDGMIDCWELVDLEGFKKKIEQGWVRTRLPDNAGVYVAGIHFTAVDINRKQIEIEETEFIRQVEDEIRWLNGQPTTATICREAFDAYQRAPSDAAKATLREAYEAVPKHMRQYILGSMEDKDSEIRLILGMKS